MPSNFTENYNLSQWERADQVKMEDFNADNAKIDAALKAESDARAALQTALNAKGNCRIVYQTYTGDGAKTRTFTFPGKPLVVFFSNGGVEFIVTVNGALKADCNFTGSHYTDVAWSGNSVTLTDPGYASNMNASGRTHIVAALIAAD